MPKKSGSAHGGAQRNRPKVQKNIELVRQTASRERRSEENAVQDSAEASAVSTATVTTPEPEVEEAATVAASEAQVQEVSEKAAPEPQRQKKAPAASAGPQGQKASEQPAAPATKRSASARLAARRQAGQRPQRNQAQLITAEHFTYVRHDLIIIGILAGIMVVAMIILYFVLVVNGLF